jgi:phosphotransferase system HPr (HPr) family protein
VRAALRFEAKIVVSANNREADAKSLLSILALGAKRGTSLGLRAEGEDAAAALDALVATVGGLRE